MNIPKQADRAKNVKKKIKSFFEKIKKEGFNFLSLITLSVFYGCVKINENQTNPRGVHHSLRVEALPLRGYKLGFYCWETSTAVSRSIPCFISICNNASHPCRPYRRWSQVCAQLTVDEELEKSLRAVQVLKWCVCCCWQPRNRK